MQDADVIKVFKCLADNSRLQIIKSLIQEDMYVEQLAERLALTAATVSFHLKKLVDARIVTFYRDQYYTMYSLCENVLQKSIYEIVREDFKAGEELERREEEYRKKVIASFFEFGELKTIPAQRKKERIILEEIAKVFEAEKVYSEQEVNEVISRFHKDYCTLRRDMVDEGIMIREDARYWKAKQTKGQP